MLGSLIETKDICCTSKNMKISVVVFCLFVGLSVGHPSRRRTNHRKPERKEDVERSPEKGRWQQKRELTEKQSEKMFFCHMAHKACRLVEAGEEPLVDRTCYSEAACDGPSGTISLDGTDYTITFCARPEDELNEDERIQRMLKRERREHKEALQKICKPPRKSRGEGSKLPERKLRWFHRACKVNNGEEDLQTRACKGESTCTKGPYDAELDGQDVEVTFCERKEEAEEKKGSRKEGQFWYEESCQVTDGEKTLKENGCPADLECIIRLSDMEYDSKRVDAGYCGGFLLRHRRRGGASGGRQHSGRRVGFKGRLMGHGRRKSRGESKGQQGGERKGKHHGSRQGKGDRKWPKKRQGKNHRQYF